MNLALLTAPRLARLDPRTVPRTYTGNLCGIRLPGLPPIPGGASDPSLVLSWFYDRYADWQRASVCGAWRAYPYPDVLLSWPDSRAAGFSLDGFVATCRELVADGFRPCVMGCSKDYDDPARLLTDLPPVLDRLIAEGVIARFCIGWELSLWLSPAQVQALIDVLAPRCVDAGVKCYVHFQQGYFAYQPDGGVTADFWRANVGKLTGLLHQRDLSWSEAEYPARITDCLERFAGGFGCPADSGFGHPFDFIAFEVTAAEQYAGRMSEAEGNRWGRIALATPAVNGVAVMGSGNGR